MGHINPGDQHWHTGISSPLIKASNVESVSMP